MNQVNTAPLSSVVKAKGRKSLTSVAAPEPSALATPEAATPGSNGSTPTTTTADVKVPKHQKTRVYLVRSRDGKRREYVKANSRSKAILYMAMSDWSANAASGEELFEAGKSGAEIYDATGLAEGE